MKRFTNHGDAQRWVAANASGKVAVIVAPRKYGNSPLTPGDFAWSYTPPVRLAPMAQLQHTVRGNPRSARTQEVACPTSEKQ